MWERHGEEHPGGNSSVVDVSGKAEGALANTYSELVLNNTLGGKSKG